MKSPASNVESVTKNVFCQKKLQFVETTRNSTCHKFAKIRIIVKVNVDLYTSPLRRSGVDHTVLPANTPRLPYSIVHIV